MQQHDIEAALDEAVLTCKNWNTTFVILTREARPKVVKVTDQYPARFGVVEFEKFPGGGQEDERPELVEAKIVDESDVEDHPLKTGVYELIEETGLLPRSGCYPRVLGFTKMSDNHLKVAVWLWADEVVGNLVSREVPNHARGGKTYRQEWVDFYDFRSVLTDRQHWIWDLAKTRILDIEFPRLN